MCRHNYELVLSTSSSGRPSHGGNLDPPDKVCLLSATFKLHWLVVNSNEASRLSGGN